MGYVAPTDCSRALEWVTSFTVLFTTAEYKFLSLNLYTL